MSEGTDIGGAQSAVVWLPDLLYVGGRFARGAALVSDGSGRVLDVLFEAGELLRETGRTLDCVAHPPTGRLIACRLARLPGRAMLPGMVNAHSHAFQRVIRGRTEYRTSQPRDSFWTWREQMYHAAARLTPEDLYDASRMAFLEMVTGGITSVGEFHYLHRTPEGAEYDDPDLLAKQVVAAARDVGLRIALLRVAYARAGFERPPDSRQARFIEVDPATYLRRVESLAEHLRRQQSDEMKGETNNGAPLFAWVGVAPHSVRAVPLDYLREACAFAEARRLPVHMHVAEQPAELAACVAEHGRTPVALLAGEELLNERFTAVHAVHVTDGEARLLRQACAHVCACPTTERNLGDGVVPADLFSRAGVRVSLGTDSHAQIDLLEDARELEYHLRLLRQERNVLAPPCGEAGAAGAHVGEARGGDEGEARSGGDLSALAARLFGCASVNGARSIGLEAGGEFVPGAPADFFTVALDDLSIAGASADDLLPAIVFSLARTAVREVAVGGRLLVEEGRHKASAEVVSRFNSLQRKLWGD